MKTFQPADVIPQGLEDPSEIYRPQPPMFELDKNLCDFRSYDDLTEDQSRVRDTYYAMHKNQTFEYAKSQVLVVYNL